jgi:hypothetical protein
MARRPESIAQYCVLSGFPCFGDITRAKARRIGPEFCKKNNNVIYLGATKPFVGSSLPFSSKMAKGISLEKDAAILMEFDPSSPYEAAVRDFAQEHLASGGQVLAFTSKASPISNALGGSNGIRLFIMSERASPASSDPDKRETLIIHNDPDLILNFLGQSLKEETPRMKSVIFDNLSNMILLLGVEKTYKFAKRANEMLFDSGAGSLFLLISGAHEDRTRTAIESIFRRIILFDRAGMKVKK